MLHLHLDGNVKAKRRAAGATKAFAFGAAGNGDAFVEEALTAALDIATARTSTNLRSDCGANFRVIQRQAQTSGGAAGVKGVVAAVCRHLTITALVPMTTGEKYYLHLAAALKSLSRHTALDLNAPNPRKLLMMNDISCSFRPWCERAVNDMSTRLPTVNRLQQDPAFAGWTANEAQMFLDDHIEPWLPHLQHSAFATSQMHSYAHVAGCSELTAVRNQWKAGLSVGEEAEQIFSFVSAHSEFLRTMRPQTWRQVLSLLITAKNTAMALRLASRLRQKFLRAQLVFREQQAKVIELAAKLDTANVDLNCTDISAIEEVLDPNSTVMTWHSNFLARAQSLQVEPTEEKRRLGTTAAA
jgi:hypothetical protein